MIRVATGDQSPLSEWSQGGTRRTAADRLAWCARDATTPRAGRGGAAGHGRPQKGGGRRAGEAELSPRRAEHRAAGEC